MPTRRDFLATLAAGGAFAAGPRFASAAPTAASAGLVAGIEKFVVRRGCDGSGPTWFHPRACVLPGRAGAPESVFMTLQTIAGSDYFGPLHAMTSVDRGRTWTDPQPVPPLARVLAAVGAEEGVCDVVPEWHAATRSVLALGHKVFYRSPKFTPDQPTRRPVYSVFRDGRWGPRRALAWADPRGADIYTNNCGQRITLPSGDILLAFSHGASRSQPRSVTTAVCAFDGEILAVRRVGAEIAHDRGRGLLEPSLVAWRDRAISRCAPRTGTVTSARARMASLGRQNKPGYGTTADRSRCRRPSSIGCPIPTPSGASIPAATRATSTSSAGARHSGLPESNRARFASSARRNGSFCPSSATACATPIASRSWAISIP